MGGLVWEALPIAVEMLGVTDVERLVWQLFEIQRRENG